MAGVEPGWSLGGAGGGGARSWRAVSGGGETGTRYVNSNEYWYDRY